MAFASRNRELSVLKGGWVAMVAYNAFLTICVLVAAFFTAGCKGGRDSSPSNGAHKSAVVVQPTGFWAITEALTTSAGSTNPLALKVSINKYYHRVPTQSLRRKLREVGIQTEFSKNSRYRDLVGCPPGHVTSDGVLS